MSTPEPNHHYLRCKREDGSECSVDLTELEEALDGPEFLECYFLPATGRTVTTSANEDFDEDEEPQLPEGMEALPLDRIGSRTQFEWMEEFANSVQSITARFQLNEALRGQKPFRRFKDVLIEFPRIRELWFAFEQQQFKRAAISLIEDLGWKVLEVVDDRPEVVFSEPQDPSTHAAITEEERTWILRGAWEVARRGGRTQLALLLKGSKNKDLLKHKLENTPAYGKLSLLTIREIEDRIDQCIHERVVDLVRSGDLPLIALTSEGWMLVQAWAHQEEARRAAIESGARLNQIVSEWRNRPRAEQVQILEALHSLPPDQVQRVVEVWHAVSGKEMRSRLEQSFQLG